MATTDANTNVDISSNSLSRTWATNHLKGVHLAPLELGHHGLGTYDAMIGRQAARAYPGLPMRNAKDRSFYLRVTDTVAYAIEVRRGMPCHLPPELH